VITSSDSIVSQHSSQKTMELPDSNFFNSNGTMYCSYCQDTDVQYNSSLAMELFFSLYAVGLCPNHSSKIAPHKMRYTLLHCYKAASIGYLLQDLQLDLARLSLTPKQTPIPAGNRRYG
jgi:hypothetical protein